MKRTKQQKDSEQLEAAIFNGAPEPKKEQKDDFDFDTFKLKELSDFEIYNTHVRKHNRICINERNKMKIKVPDESYHKKMKIKFHKMQQSENIQKIRVRNKDIDWEGQLKSGGTYMLALPVIRFLNKLAIPIFAEVKTEHGNAVHTETRQVGEEPRFSCSVIDFE